LSGKKGSKRERGGTVWVCGCRVEGGSAGNYRLGGLNFRFSIKPGGGHRGARAGRKKQGQGVKKLIRVRINWQRKKLFG